MFKFNYIKFIKKNILNNYKLKIFLIYLIGFYELYLHSIKNIIKTIKTIKLFQLILPIIFYIIKILKFGSKYISLTEVYGFLPIFVEHFIVNPKFFKISKIIGFNMLIIITLIYIRNLSLTCYNVLCHLISKNNIKNNDITYFDIILIYFTYLCKKYLGYFLLIELIILTIIYFYFFIFAFYYKKYPKLIYPFNLFTKSVAVSIRLKIQKNKKLK
jgi:hypothetical protein